MTSRYNTTELVIGVLLGTIIGMCILLAYKTMNIL